MKLTRATEYAMLTMVYLAKQTPGSMTLTADIADHEGIPNPFLVKVIPLLSKAGLVKTHRGSHGGLSLGRPLDSISLKDIVEAIEGQITINTCTGQDPLACTRSDCKLRGALRDAQDQFLHVLASYTLASFAQGESPMGSRR